MAAADSVASGLADSPQTIHVGVYINQVNGISLRANQFEVDFVIWFRGHSEDFDPIATFDVIDGQIQAKTAITTSKSAGGINYASCRVVCKITKFWNVSRFPRDDHTLRVAIEDGSNEEFRVQYVADTANCGISPHLEVPGWTVGTPTAEIEQHQYHTNYGDMALPTGNTSSYSQFTYTIPLTRPDWGYFFVKLFFGLFVAAAIAFLAFCIEPGDSRFGIGAGAIFAAVASQYITASNLPDTNLLTMADLLHILAFLFIFLSIAESVVATHLFKSGRQRCSRLLDICSAFILGGAYVGSSAWSVIHWGQG